MQLKQDCPEEDTQLTTLHDVVIASLRHQLDEMQQTLDFLRASDQSLRLALRVSDMRVQETEVELSKAIERYIIITLQSAVFAVTPRGPIERFLVHFGCEIQVPPAQSV